MEPQLFWQPTFSRSQWYARLSSIYLQTFAEMYPATRQAAQHALWKAYGACLVSGRTPGILQNIVSRHLGIILMSESQRVTACKFFYKHFTAYTAIDRGHAPIRQIFSCKHGGNLVSSAALSVHIWQHITTQKRCMHSAHFQRCVWQKY